MDINDPLVIGRLLEKAQEPPAGTTTVQLAWRTGYQNAMSDLIAEVWPDAKGNKRLSIEEMAAEDDGRAARQ